MTKVIVAQNCPRCGAEPRNPSGYFLECPNCPDMYAYPDFNETFEDCIIKWNKLGVKRPIVFNDKTYIDADVLLDWLNEMIEPFIMRITYKDMDGNIIKQYPDSIHGDGLIFDLMKRKVEQMKAGVKTVDGVEE